MSRPPHPTKDGWAVKTEGRTSFDRDEEPTWEGGNWLNRRKHAREADGTGN